MIYSCWGGNHSDCFSLGFAESLCTLISYCSGSLKRQNSSPRNFLKVNTCCTHCNTACRVYRTGNNSPVQCAGTSGFFPAQYILPYTKDHMFSLLFFCSPKATGLFYILCATAICYLIRFLCDSFKDFPLRTSTLFSDHCAQWRSHLIHTL